MQLDIRDVRKVVDRLFSHLIETRGITHIDLEENYYWQIEPSQVFRLEAEPTSFITGSFEDEWELVSTLLDKTRQPTAYQLSEMAPLLGYIGELLSETLASKGG